MYVLKLEQEQFEGPMELLLSLIERRRLDVTRLSLARIAEEYVAYLAAEREVPLGNLADFLGVAAQLLLIKSKSLLPFLVLEEEEEESIEDLEQRLREYKRFKDASLLLGALFARGHRSVGRPRSTLSSGAVFYPPSRVDVPALERSFVSVLGEIPFLQPLEEESIEDVVTLEEKILVLREAFSVRAEASFHEMVEEAGDRMDVIVSFLALLELVKQRVVHAEQTDLFVEIRLKKLPGEKML